MFLRNIFCILVLTLMFFAVQEAASEVNIVIDGDFADWEDVPVLIEDPDDIAEDNGDIKEIRVHSNADTFYAMLTVYGTAAPKDDLRYYYHILIDADNNLKTGFDNSMYEDSETGVKNPIGADFYAQVGTQQGAANGIEVYFLTANSDDKVAENFRWMAGGDSIEVAVPFAMFNPLQNLGEIFIVNQTVMIAAFQEGSANDWEVDWTESAEHRIGISAAVDAVGKLAVTWADIKAF